MAIPGSTCVPWSAPSLNCDFLSYTIYSLCFLQLNHTCSPQPFRCFRCTHLCLARGTSTPLHVSALICRIIYALTCVKHYLKFAVITSCVYKASLWPTLYALPDRTCVSDAPSTHQVSLSSLCWFVIRSRDSILSHPLKVWSALFSLSFSSDNLDSFLISFFNLLRRAVLN